VSIEATRSDKVISRAAAISFRHFQNASSRLTLVANAVDLPDAQDPLTVCRPLGVEIYRLEEELLNGWSQPERAAYKGQHGLHIAKAAWE